ASPLVEAPPAEPEMAAVPVPDSHKATPRIGLWTTIAAALVCASVIGFGVGRRWSPGQAATPSQPTHLARFWSPITSTSGRVTYCLGEPNDAVDLRVRTTFGVTEDGSLNVYDVVTLARSIVPLVPGNGEFRVLAASATGFAQLREGPFVLIGAFDNPWTMRITQGLPFGFEYDNDLRKIVDRKSGGKRFWTLR